MNRLRVWTEVAAAETALAAARWLPRRRLLGFGGAVGALAGRLDRRHAAIARENLSAAYGDAMPAAEKGRVLGACWRHFGRMTFDSLALLQLNRSALAKLVTFEREDIAREALARGRGALVCSAHFGHWEAGAFSMALLGISMAAIARPQNNPIVDRRLVELRRISGFGMIPKRRAVRESLKALAHGTCVAMLIDQDAREDGVFVPFFGRLASTTPALALLALRTGAPILPMSALARPDGTLTVRVEPVVETRPEADRDAEILRVTAACTAIVEGWVRSAPEQWLWMHRRWKTRPPGERSGEV